MKGAEHYAEAERLLKRQPPWETRDGIQLTWEQAHMAHMAFLAQAQIHATLAVASSNLVMLEKDDWEPADASH